MPFLLQVGQFYIATTTLVLIYQFISLFLELRQFIHFIFFTADAKAKEQEAGD